MQSLSPAIQDHFSSKCANLVTVRDEMIRTFSEISHNYQANKSNQRLKINGIVKVAVEETIFSRVSKIIYGQIAFATKEITQEQLVSVEHSFL
jgi:hypothetical protein